MRKTAPRLHVLPLVADAVGDASSLAVVLAVAAARRRRATKATSTRGPSRRVLTATTTSTTRRSLRTVAPGVSIAVDVNGNCRKHDVRAALTEIGGTAMMESVFDPLWEELNDAGGDLCRFEYLRDAASVIDRAAGGEGPENVFRGASNAQTARIGREGDPGVPLNDERPPLELAHPSLDYAGLARIEEAERHAVPIVQ